MFSIIYSLKKNYCPENKHIKEGGGYKKRIAKKGYTRKDVKTAKKAPNPRMTEYPTP